MQEINETYKRTKFLYLGLSTLKNLKRKKLKTQVTLCYIEPTRQLQEAESFSWWCLLDLHRSHGSEQLERNVPYQAGGSAVLPPVRQEDADSPPSAIFTRKPTPGGQWAAVKNPQVS